MERVADGCVFTLHVSEDLVDHAGQWVGADQIRMALTMARRHYDYILYRPIVLGANGSSVRVRVEFMGTHRLSREAMNMTFRQVFTVENGQIVRCDEYHDRPKLEAYLKLIQSYPLPPPEAEAFAEGDK